jgi:hypothetical protein
VAERKKRWPICRWHFTTVAITIKDFSDGKASPKVLKLRQSFHQRSYEGEIKE